MDYYNEHINAILERQLPSVTPYARPHDGAFLWLGLMIFENIERWIRVR